MNFAAHLGCNSGRATPSLRRTQMRMEPTRTPRQKSTYLPREAVQTNRATSIFGLPLQWQPKYLRE